MGCICPCETRIEGQHRHVRHVDGRVYSRAAVHERVRRRSLIDVLPLLQNLVFEAVQEGVGEAKISR